MDASSGDDQGHHELSKIIGLRQYLVTYQNANLDKFPTMKSFGEMVENEFNRGDGKAKVEYWSCCLEFHKDGTPHYHCAVKLSQPKKWIGVMRNIYRYQGVHVDFSTQGNFYISAYRYLRKFKEANEVEHSSNHPKDLIDSGKLSYSPSVKKANATFQQNSNKRRSLNETNVNVMNDAPPVAKRKKTPLSNSEVGDFVRSNNIQTLTELSAKAEERREAGQSDVSDFIYKRSIKSIEELISKTWIMTQAREKIRQDQISRMDRVLSSLHEKCVCRTNKWLDCALEVLRLNNIPKEQFAGAVKTLLLHGRGKFRNILIYGEENCAKTFILMPLKAIFLGDKLFENPATDKYAWVGAEKAQVMLLNDFRWSKDLIQWHDFLNLLEGNTVRLPAPKNIYSEDIIIKSDVAIFATSISPISHRGVFNMTDSTETSMMKIRWKTFHFKHKFDLATQKDTTPCANCFANLVLG